MEIAVLSFVIEKKCLDIRFALQYWIVTKAPKVAKAVAAEADQGREGANRSSLSPSSLSPIVIQVESPLLAHQKRGWIATTMSLGG